MMFFSSQNNKIMKQCYYSYFKDEVPRSGKLSHLSKAKWLLSPKARNETQVWLDFSAGVPFPLCFYPTAKHQKQQAVCFQFFSFIKEETIRRMLWKQGLLLPLSGFLLSSFGQSLFSLGPFPPSPPHVFVETLLKWAGPSTWTIPLAPNGEHQQSLRF